MYDALHSLTGNLIAVGRRMIYWAGWPAATGDVYDCTFAAARRPCRPPLGTRGRIGVCAVSFTTALRPTEKDRGAAGDDFPINVDDGY